MLIRYSCASDSTGESFLFSSRQETLASVPSKTCTSQNLPAAIAINQNGNIRRADGRGYINVGIRETYKIEFNSPSYTSAVSVKIDGVSI